MFRSFDREQERWMNNRFHRPALSRGSGESPRQYLSMFKGRILQTSALIHPTLPGLRGLQLLTFDDGDLG